MAGGVPERSLCVTNRRETVEIKERMRRRREKGACGEHANSSPPCAFRETERGGAISFLDHSPPLLRPSPNQSPLKHSVYYQFQILGSLLIHLHKI